MDRFNSLPEEITVDIISRLPTELVLECKLVCTNWRSLVRHSSFSKMHLNRLNNPSADSGKMSFIALTGIRRIKKDSFHYFEYNENHESIESTKRLNFISPFWGDTVILGTCNGLICVYQDKYLAEKITYIFNPIISEYIKLPEINKVATFNYRSLGFGYVSSTNEYKVVSIMSEKGTEFIEMSEKGNQFIEVYVYTLGSGHGWRNLGKFNFGTRGDWENGVFVNEALYWWDYQLKTIFSFDLVAEKFCEHLSPPTLPNRYFEHHHKSDDYQLGVLDGCLSFAIDVNGADCLAVWLLRKKDENQGMTELEGHQSMSWREEFRVYDRQLLAVTKSYNVLTYNGVANHIKIHDLEASTSKVVVGFNVDFVTVFPHKNTFVSLRELGEEDTKIIESVEI